jgi:hypothetical protein
VSLHEFPIPHGYFLGPDDKGKGTLGPPARPTTALLDTIAATGRPKEVSDDDRAKIREDIKFWNASVFVLGKTAHEDLLLQAMTDLLGPGRRVDDVWIWDVRQ